MLEDETGAGKRHARHAPADGVAARRSAATADKRTILVVEDNLLIADWICDSLQEDGCAIVGPVGSLQAACALARTAEIDGAVLDLKLGQDLCLPVAAVLKARRIPFVVLTGYSGRPDFLGVEPAAWIAKPMKAGALTEAIGLMLGGRDTDDAAARREEEIHDESQVILVDDDDDFREVLSADLADRGFNVACFADGPALLASLGDGVTAQVAVLDWGMPGMSGFELLGALRQRGFGLPVVFLTGYAVTERELQALGHGAVDFVDKARGTDVLAHRLRVIIEAHRRPAGAAEPTVQQVVEQHGALTLQPATARALWQGRDVGLTMTEYKMVVHLVSRKGLPQSYRTLYDTAHYAGFVAGSGEHGHNTNVRSLVKRIRRKFLAIDPGFAEIENLTGIGYQWRRPERRDRQPPSSHT